MSGWYYEFFNEFICIKREICMYIWMCIIPCLHKTQQCTVGKFDPVHCYLKTQRQREQWQINWCCDNCDFILKQMTITNNSDTKYSRNQYKD